MQDEWRKICHILAEKLQNGHYKVWIAPLKAACIGETLRLVALNDFVASFVRTRFTAEILQAATMVLGYAPQIEILSAEAFAEQHPLEAAALDCTDVHVQQPDIAGQTDNQSPLNKTDQNLPEYGQHTPQEAPSANLSLIGAKAAVPAQPLYPQAFYPQSAQSGFAAPREKQTSLPLRWSPSAARPAQWRYSFSDFVVGPSNELAHAAAHGICRTCGQSAGVLYLCSPPGLGKTHLMQAVGQGLGEACNFSSARIEYLTAEEFSARIRMALKSGDIDSFKARYRDADVLLLEDVHFLQGKEKFQGELLATITALLERGSRVVFSSSFAPRDLRDMDSQLLSRLRSGLIASIDRPDAETRKRIIRQKASVHQVLLPEEITEFLAAHIHDDVRQIESCLQNLILKARLLNCHINMQLAREAVMEYAATAPALDMEAIVRYVCQGFGLLPDQLNSKSRKKEYVQARSAAFYLARKHTELSLQEIGNRFNRNHSTVIKGITSLEREMARQTSAGRQLSSAISLIERSSLA